MLSALLYLRLTSLRNWLLSRVRRLRQPKYLVGAIVGTAYLYFFFIRGFAPRHKATAPPLPVAELQDVLPVAVPADWLPAVAAFGAIALLIVATLMWVVPVERAALGFTEAEIAFLFPAPITRRRLVHFRLLSSQLRSLAGAAVMMLFSHRWTFLGGNALTHAIGWWFVFSTLNLHFTGANFTLTRLADLGVGGWRRRGLVLAGVAAIVAATWLRLPAASRTLLPGDEANLTTLTGPAIDLTSTAPLSWLLWPLRQVLGPFLALDARAFFLALGPALAVVTLHYLWVVRSAVAFEDSSIEAAQKRRARIDAWSANGRRTSAPTKGRAAPFGLAAGGRPELAFLWKNLLSTWPYFTPRVWLGCAGVIVVGATWLRSQPGLHSVATGLGGVALIFGAYAVVVGPQFARQDIRSDLANTDILKTYPLAGWQIILGELLAPAAILTGVLWLTLLATVALLGPDHAGAGWLTPPLRIAGAVGLAILAPALVLIQLIVPNAAALLFPAWFQATRTRGGGPEVIGQRMIFFFAQMLTMLLALLPAAGLAALLVFILQWLVGPVAAVAVATAAALVILAGEFAVAVWWLGDRFEKLDLTAELRS